MQVSIAVSFSSDEQIREQSRTPRGARRLVCVCLPFTLFHSLHNVPASLLVDSCFNRRFIVNCPEEEFESFERLFFQIEQAHWFYDDFYRPKANSLPPVGLREFSHLSKNPFAWEFSLSETAQFSSTAQSYNPIKPMWTKFLLTSSSTKPKYQYAVRYCSTRR